VRLDEKSRDLRIGRLRSNQMHADRLLPPLPLVTNVNNGRLTEFAELLEIAGNEIYTYYGTIM